MTGSDQIVSYRPLTAYAQPVAYSAPGSYATAGSEEFDFSAIGRLLLRRKLLIIVTTLLITLCAAAATLFMTPQYSATAYVMIEPGQTRVVEAIEAVVAGSSADTAAVESQMRLLQSRTLADRVMSVLNLSQDPEFNAKLEPPGLLDQTLAPMKQAIAGLVSEAKQWIAGAGDTPKTGDPARALRTQIIDKVLSGLEVRIEGRSRVISVTFTSRSAQTAAAVANTLAEQYIAMQLEGKFEATRNAGQWLNERVQDLRQRVQMAEAAVEKYRADNGLISAGNVSITTEEASGVGSQLALARSKRADAEARLRELEGSTADGSGAATISEVLGSGLIQNLRQQEAEIERRVSELSQNLGRSHPDLLSARAELGEIRAKIETETQKIVQKLKNEVTAATAREAALSQTLEALKGRVGQQNQVEVKLRALEREATASRTLLETFLARAEEAGSQADFQQADARMVSLADVPNGPVAPRKSLIVAVGFFAALGAAVLLAFLLEFRDSGFRSEEQIEQTLGVASLGLVPSLKRSWVRSQRPSVYVTKHPASAYVESIRGLCTSLRLSNGDHLPRVVLIASALPNEGKTTLATSFASFLSSVGLRALVIDTDLRKPSVHLALGVAARPGLIDYLKNQTPLTSIIQHDPSTGIDVIAAGRSRTNRADMLGTEQMKELLGQLRATYDVVILDSAPLLAVAESRILVRIADKTVFLIRWADTRRNTAMRCLQQIAVAGSNVVGVMLTMVDLHKYSKHRYGEFGHYYPRIESYYAA
jgi:capsular exopolysaccharide synthesis family protein